MTSLTNTLTSFVSTVFDKKRSSPMILPTVMENTYAMVFVSTVRKGKMTKGNNTGFIVRRDPTTICGWSLPMCISFTEGDLYWKKTSLPCKKGSLILMITNQTIADSIFTTGKYKFDVNNKEIIKSGIVAESQDDVEEILRRVDKRDDLDLTCNTFSYVIAKGYTYSCHIDSAVLEMRRSSNLKFYRVENPKAADLKWLSLVKKDAVTATHLLLRKLFKDVANESSSLPPEQSGLSEDEVLVIEQGLGSTKFRRHATSSSSSSSELSRASSTSSWSEGSSRSSVCSTESGESDLDEALESGVSLQRTNSFDFSALIE